MTHISASAAPIRVKQKPLYSKLNVESDKYYYNSLCKSLENSPESLSTVQQSRYSFATHLTVNTTTDLVQLFRITCTAKKNIAVAREPEIKF